MKKMLSNCFLLAALVACGSQKESESEVQVASASQPTESQVLKKIAKICAEDENLCTESLIDYYQHRTYERDKLVAHEIPEEVIVEVEAGLTRIAGGSSDCLKIVFQYQYHRGACR